MVKQLQTKLMLLLCMLVAGVGSVWASTVTYQHIFTAKPATGNSVNLSGVNWKIEATNLNAYQSSYAGVQIGTKNSPGSITLTSVYSWGEQTGNYYEKIKITEVRLWLNNGSGEIGTYTVTIGGKTATPSGTISKNSSASSYSDASTITYTPAEDGYTGIVAINVATSSKAGYICALEIDCEEQSETIAVEGISLNKSEITLTAGDTETLTPTITPSNATNKVVSWESSNPAVATVDAGVVTGVSKGTAVITATTNDGSYTSTCNVTVNPAPEASVIFDFTDSGWGFPNDTNNKVEGPSSYTCGGYTITLKGSSGNGFYYDSSAGNLLLGKSGATLTFPAFPFNVKKINVYGSDGASGSVTFNIFVDDDAVSNSATSAKVTHSFVIASDKQEKGTIYVLKVTNGNNTRISKIEIFGYETVNVSSAGFATYVSDNDLDYTNVEGLEAFSAQVDNANATVSFTQVGKVKAGEGVLLKANGGSYNVPVTSGVDANTANDFIRGEGTAVKSEDNGKYNYILNNVDNVVAFYAANGQNVATNRAYLQTTTTNARISLNFDDETTTGINATLKDKETNSKVYNLNGQCVDNPAKGLYIVNGKKVIIK